MIRLLLLILFHRKGVSDMLAKLYAIHVVKGTWDYDRVPRLLKDKVDEELRAMDLEELIK